MPSNGNRPMGWRSAEASEKRRALEQQGHREREKERRGFFRQVVLAVVDKAVLGIFVAGATAFFSLRTDAVRTAQTELLSTTKYRLESTEREYRRLAAAEDLLHVYSSEMTRTLFKSQYAEATELRDAFAKTWTEKGFSGGRAAELWKRRRARHRESHLDVP